MSDTALYLSLGIVLLGICIVMAFVMTIKRRYGKKKGEYHWKPEQDYDVVLRGETPMTPGTPILVPRDKARKNNKSDD